jgi:hypothetical protein
VSGQSETLPGYAHEGVVDTCAKGDGLPERMEVRQNFHFRFEISDFRLKIFLFRILHFT